MSANETLVSLTDLSKDFDVSPPFLNRLIERQDRLLLKAVDGVTIDIPRGKTVSLVGESGCGKSTVARLVVGLYTPTRGGILFDGIDMATLKTQAEIEPVRKRMQMIFQDPYASLNPRWRVSDIIAEPIRAHKLLSGRDTIARRDSDQLRSFPSPHIGLSLDRISWRRTYRLSPSHETPTRQPSRNSTNGSFRHQGRGSRELTFGR
jgi:peptide/nickel transport system ATP-binding protein